MKLSDLLQMSPSLQALGALKLPAKVSYRVAKILNKVKPDLTAYEEARMGIFKEMGTPDERGESYSVAPEKMDEFKAAFEALTAEEVTLDLPKIKLSELDSVSIEPSHLAALDSILIDDSAESAPK